MRSLDLIPNKRLREFLWAKGDNSNNSDNNKDNKSYKTLISKGLYLK